MRRAKNAQVAFYAFLGLLGGLGVGYVFLGSIDRSLRSISKKQALQTQLNHGLSLDEEGSHHAILERTSEPQEVQKGNIADIRLQEKPKHSSPQQGDTIHTLFTSNGTPYINFQTRILYGTYKIVQNAIGGEKLVGFTRILHRTKPDALMNEVPTFRAEPLTPECDGWCEFPVSDRPNAVAQYLAAAKEDPSMIKAPWILMLEGDYVWMKPLQAPRAESPLASWAFPYSYIQPQHPDFHDILRLMYPEEKGSLGTIPHTGPAPVLMRVNEWRKVTPEWERLTAHIENHPETKKKLGWVREMYAFSIATALQGIALDLSSPPTSLLMAQPPQDHDLGSAALLHYTWGVIVEQQNGESVWSFDKRTYTAPEIERQARPPLSCTLADTQTTPLIPLPPDWQSGWKLHEGQAYTADLNKLVTSMLQQMNRAIAQLPRIERHS